MVQMVSVNRVLNLPLVETGRDYAGQLYSRVKQSNGLLYWACNGAETSLNLYVKAATPIAGLFQTPLNTVDKIICKSLDAVEEKVPQIHLPPDQIYTNAKQYVNDVGDRLVRPILQRADSVKQLGNSVMESKYTALAADKLEDALNVADKYVDKYLPADVTDGEESQAYPSNSSPKANQTIQHVGRFSRKIQRRLTRRTLAEAKAFKEHGTEAIHVFLYVADLIASDPKLAVFKTKELWTALSENEPENQARPANLEEALVMLTRESARKIVHLVNFSNEVFSDFPRHLGEFTNSCLHTAENLLTAENLSHANKLALEEMRLRAHQLTVLLYRLNLYTTELLEKVARNLEKQVHPTATNHYPILHKDELRPPSNASQSRATRVFYNISNGTE